MNVQDDPSDTTPPVVAASQAVTPADQSGPATPNPAWAKDLQKLYNAVVEEPLPDSFMALLAQLDTDE